MSVKKRGKDMELVSHDMWGVKIFDHTPTNKGLVHITVNPKGVTCGRCETDNCQHIQYILTHVELQKTFNQKRRQNWNIPEPDT